MYQANAHVRDVTRETGLVLSVQVIRKLGMFVLYV